ncbi:MAG: cysteine desulfurase [Lactobacillales bacterium]|jgi:cysteine desulfurase|nr:cysteine desulfurase [Lactobacillales bacterium]
MKNAIYFDHAATTPVNPLVIQAMTEVLTQNFGNPSSIHQFGRKAHKLLAEARKEVTNSLQVKDSEIIFTSGGTESNNAAIIGMALKHKDKGRHLLTTAIEHPSVLMTMKYLKEQFGFEVTYLSVDKAGNLSVKAFKQALRKDTILVSVMAVNNETGNLLPIQEIGEILRNHKAIFHTDIVQAIGLLEINPEKLGIDLLSASAHKLNGPKGVGFLYKSANLPFMPFFHGGEQEGRFRAGTENLASIVGLKKAIEILNQDERKQRFKKYQILQDLLFRKLDEAKVKYHLNGDLNNKLPNILNLHLENVASNLTLMKLDLKGFAISIGSACTAGNVSDSYVLAAMYGKDHPVLRESIRISFGEGNTKEQVEKLANELIALSQKTNKEEK